MVRYRYTDSVLIQLSGPKSILPEPVTEYGRLGMTWLHFCNTTCGLQLDTDSDYFVCTSTYTTTAVDSGWTANLNDQIRPFIDQYSRRREKYCVRLHTGSEPPPNTSETANNSNAATLSSNNNDNNTPFVPSIIRKPATVTPAVRKFATAIPLTTAQMTALRKNLPAASSSFARPAAPAIVIPTRGAQVITPIQPVIPQPKHSNHNGHAVARTGSGGAQPSASGGLTLNPIVPPRKRMIPAPSQSIREFSIRVGAGTKSTANGGSSQADPSPPRLTRYDEPVAGTSKSFRNILAQSKPGTSSNTTAGGPPSAKRSRRTNNTRFDEDNWRQISGLAGVKIEPVEVDLNEMQAAENRETNNPEQDLSQSEIFNQLGIDDDDDNDDASMCTAASQEENELRRSGIPVEDIKSLIEGRFDRFDEDMLHRVKNEIKRLKKNKTWERNVRRSPLLCYLLSELFKEL